MQKIYIFIFKGKKKKKVKVGSVWVTSEFIYKRNELLKGRKKCNKNWQEWNELRKTYIYILYLGIYKKNNNNKVKKDRRPKKNK
jgi:hypothetical protein